MIRPICNLLVFGAALISTLTHRRSPGKSNQETQVKPTSPVSGAQMFKEYCAVCHGPGGKGDGLVATALKTPPPDLTTLAQRHDGNFPDDYVSNVLKNGVKSSAHGSGEMPVWGPIFDTMNRWKALCPGMIETPVALRITNLTNYLKSIQKR
jgi:mono/diheme cytochrome c family protein